jgi:hypothetical protein
MKTANATNAISNRSNGREAEKMLWRRDTTPYMIEFPTPQPAKPVRSSEAPKPHRTKQKESGHNHSHAVGTKKQVIWWVILQREIFLMASSSTADFPH